MSIKQITVRGARQHNLKTSTPKSHATNLPWLPDFRVRQIARIFDTIYAEGQRRYVESLSAYARQF